MKNNITSSLSLRQALERCSWHLLIYIGRRRGLRLSSRLRKAELIDRLADGLAQPANLEQALTHLSPAAQKALEAIVTAGGRVALRHLRSRFGALRPPRQTPGHYNSPAAADPPALSPLEELRAWGLIFLDPAGRDLVVPAEPLAWLAPHLVAHNPPPNVSPAAAQPQPDHSRALEYDLAALLALLHRHPLRLRHGRWLPPWFLKMWGHHSALPPTRPTALGELQTARRRFLHYLAATAGLVNAELRMENEESNPALSPISNLQSPVSILTPAAWLWLHAPPDERTQRLWAAWLQAEADLWHRFRLPGTPWLAAPDQLLAALHPALLDQPLFEPARFAADLLARRPELIDLTPPALIEPDEALTEAITQLLTGPLYWLGITTRTDNPLLWALSTAGRRRLAGQGANLDVESAAGYQLDSHLPPEPRTGHLRLTPVGPHLPAPHHLAVVIDSAHLETPAAAGPGSYILTAATVVDALQRGWSPANLVNSLSGLLTRPLTPKLGGMG